MKFSKVFKIFLFLDLFLFCKHVITADDDLLNNFHGEERNALLALNSIFNNSFLRKNWTGIMCYESNPPIWHGIHCSSDGRVNGIILENMDLAGEIPSDALFNLTELSILSFKNNKISGKLMDFSNNQKLAEIDLSGNMFDREIPSSLTRLNSLTSLQLQVNNLEGSIPWFNQSSLKLFNVSYNILSGRIPDTVVLQSFTELSFLGNPGLCGSPSPIACTLIRETSPSGSNNSDPSKKSSASPLAPIALIVCVITLVVLFFLFIVYFKRYKALKKLIRVKNILKEEKSYNTDLEKSEVVRDQRGIIEEEGEGEGGGGGGGERGDLVFMDGVKHFELDDLLKASAEGLGKGNFGNCYKAMLENGPVVVVKRLRDLKPLSKEEFVKQLKGIAELRHPNLLPLLGYYYSKEEKLMLYNFASYGNAFNRLHGNFL